MAEEADDHPDDADKKDLQGKQYKWNQSNEHGKKADNKLTDFFYHVFHDVSLLTRSLLNADGRLSWKFLNS